MPISLSSYTDPSSYIAEVTSPGAISVSSERTLAIVAIAPRTRRTSDESIIRGKIYNETLTVAASTPYIATLTNVSTRNQNEAKLYMNGNELSVAAWSFLAAALVGTEWAGAAIDVSSGTGTAQYFTLSLDGRRVVTINMDAAVTAIAGAPAAATADDICDAINYELGNAAGTYFADYGLAYAAVATNAVGAAQKIVTITSPLTTAVSDLKVFLSMATTNDGASEISNTAWVPLATAGVQADSIIQIVDDSYAATATYTLDYICVDVLLDNLTNADATNTLSALVKAGNAPGTTNYAKDVDYRASTNDLEWDSATWADATVSALAGPYAIVLATNDDLRFAVNGGTPLTVNLAPAGAMTAAAAAILINTALNASTNYGPHYAHVASDNAGTLVFTAPDPFENFPVAKGAASSFEFFDVTASAYATLFGTATLPVEVVGVGLRPSFGAGYYATYDYARPAADYDTPTRVFDPDQLYAYTSPLTLANYLVNKMAIAGELAFENKATSVWLAQINDLTNPGVPSLSQIRAAIATCALKKSITDVVVIDTSEEIAVSLMQHVSDQSSLLAKKPRRGWYGMARGTDFGDPSTPDTFIYRSTQTLQPGNTSPGRGRQILVSPGSVSRTVTLDTGQEITMELDGSYLATAVGGAYTALPSPSSTLLGKFVTGFLTDGTFGTWLDGERHAQADKGVTVVTLDAGRLLLMDPLTTEAGGAKVVQFEEPSASAQKDAVTDTVNNLIENNLVGVVPDDLADFIADIKKWIMLGILAQIGAGTIAPFRDSAGFPRDIDALTDIVVYQSSTDPRVFYFKYWFNLKYPAKRFFGEYSVDNPFFAPAA